MCCTEEEVSSSLAIKPAGWSFECLLKSAIGWMFSRVKRKEMTVVSATGELGISVRQGRRLWKRFAASGGAMPGFFPFVQNRMSRAVSRDCIFISISINSKKIQPVAEPAKRENFPQAGENLSNPSSKLLSISLASLPVPLPRRLVPASSADGSGWRHPPAFRPRRRSLRGMSRSGCR